ncbi:MAG: hypothetical protein V4683_11445 [Bacteroidota bacterium]
MERNYKYENGWETPIEFWKEKILLNADVKANVRMPILPQILALNEQFNPYIILADKLFPEIRLQLSENKVAYLEANGNFYYQKEDKWIWIDGNAPLKIKHNNKNRAFTKTGLRVLFEFLLDENLLNMPYRQIAHLTNTAVGNVTNIINGLKEGGYLLQLTKNELRFKNRHDVILKWAENFQLNLKPQIMIGKFKFLNPNDFLNWENISLQNEKTY